MLEVITSIAFVILSLSLFATTLMEIIASVLSLRGKHLMRGISRILSNSADTQTFEGFKENVLFKQLGSKFLFKKRPPSYLSANTFALILWNLLAKNEQSITREQLLKESGNESLKDSLSQLFDTHEVNKLDFEQKTSAWFEEVMARVSGWYKRNTQAILLLLGLLISVVFDADTISIYHQLSNDPKKQLELLSQAERYLKQAEHASPSQSALMIQNYEQELVKVLKSNAKELKEPLGLGWYQESKPDSFNAWLLKVLGWIITALGISLGAPFWFDLLKKLMVIKSAGGLPQPLSTNGLNTTQGTSVAQNAKSYNEKYLKEAVG